MTNVNSEVAEGIRLARRAVEIGKDDAIALAGGGFGLAFLGGELDIGLALTDRALVLNPNFSAAWMASGWIRCYVGEPETAIQHLSQAIRLSPVDPQMVQICMATSLAMRCAGRYVEAASWASRVLQQHHDYVPALVSHAVASALADLHTDARARMSRAMQLDPALRISTMPILTVLRRPEDRSKFCEGARLAGMAE